MTNDEKINFLYEEATPFKILSLWRFEPSGSEWIDGTVGLALAKRMEQIKSVLSPEDWVRLSKSVGWA